MRYNLAKPEELKAARNRISYLATKKRQVDIKEVKRRRSLPQNSYLHLLLGAFGLHFGYTLEEAKEIYKQVNRDIYYYKKKGRMFIRSSADLDVDQMTKSIDRFRDASAAQGYPLPLAQNEEWLSLLSNEVERGERYL